MSENRIVLVNIISVLFYLTNGAKPRDIQFTMTHKKKTKQKILPLRKEMFGIWLNLTETGHYVLVIYIFGFIVQPGLGGLL